MNKLIQIFLVLLFPNLVSGQDLVRFTHPDTLKAAPDFQVKVNGQEIFVYDTEVGGMAYFDFAGEVTVEITTQLDLKWVDIRPLSLGMVPQFKDHRILFKMKKPAYLSIELNGEFKRALFLFSNEPEKEKPVNKQGVHWFEGGKVYNIGELVLHSGETVYIEGGAVVRGNITATDVRDIKILGRGILDGSYGRDNNLISFQRCRNIHIDGVILLNNSTWNLVPRFCDSIWIKQVKELSWQFGSDGIDLVATSHVVIDNCFLRNNDDCITLKSWGSNEKYPTLPDEGPSIQNITVSRITCWNMPWGNALEIGFELRCPFVENIVFRDCDIIHVERGAALSIHNGDQATVRNITYDNIRIEGAQHKLIDLAVFLSQYSKDRPVSEQERKEKYLHGAWDGVLDVKPSERAVYASNRGKIQDILFRNIRIMDGNLPFSILYGYDKNHQVKNVKIENLQVRDKRITSLRDAKFYLEETSGVTIQ